MKVSLKSAYLPAEPKDGMRYLVETLWPEGAETHSLHPYLWVREIAPSYELKERAVWKHWTPLEFRAEYENELHISERAAWFSGILSEAKKRDITLLYNSSKKAHLILPEDTPAYYLKEFLEAELNKDCPV